MQDVEAIPKVPEELIQQLQAAIEAFPKANGSFKTVALADASMRVNMHVIPFADDDAKARFKLVQQDQRAMLDSESDLAGIVERVAENTIKLATLRAISQDPRNPAVSVADIDWGWALIHKSIDSVSQGVARYMAGSNAEALRKLVYGHIRDAAGSGIPKSVLMRKAGVTKATPFELDSALQWLERSGQVANVGKPDNRGGRGRSGEKFVATELVRAAA
ncbi:hypothetical protein IVA95_23455 [Bradyrhizobium sp. 157]|uniref:hypothetical protein n=1 Tax=Bradyrhizobium sp. 157 TaxID=2782631 RepID=UPI001FFBF172|nr:hypothetical protein [Bradyrhizobium sp. 157]MCK1640459.1 hypothetical protein [Bradyrhizobium sp. 157]